MLGIYSKALAATAVAGLGAYSAALPDGVTASEVVGIVVTTLVALGAVWLIPNTPAGIARYAKAITAALISAGGPLGTGLADGTLTQTEVVTAVIAFVVGTGLTGTVANAGVSANLSIGHGLDHGESTRLAEPVSAEVMLGLTGGGQNVDLSAPEPEHEFRSEDEPVVEDLDLPGFEQTPDSGPPYTVQPRD